MYTYKTDVRIPTFSEALDCEVVVCEQQLSLSLDVDWILLIVVRLVERQQVVVNGGVKIAQLAVSGAPAGDRMAEVTTRKTVGSD